VADLSDAQRKRAEARQRRRKSEPAEENDDAGTENPASEEDDSHHAVRQAAKVAAAAGAAGAVAAAARALASHQDDDADHAPEQEEQPQREQRDEESQPEARREEPANRDNGPVDGASVSDARRALDRGRSQLEDLLGRPVESVSSLERTHDGWVLALEVVEVKRIPETTDVLASYELELDDRLDLRRYQQVRRYHRAQAERGEGT
jgi:gas vesicle protein GvpO